MGYSRILMTGGSGFVGRWMFMGRPMPGVYALNRQDYESGEWKHQEWDAIVHLANVNPYAVIQCAKRNRARVLYASSGAATDAKPGDYAQGKLDAEEMLLDSGLDVVIARMYTFCGGWMPNRFAVINMITDALTSGVIKIRGENVTRTYMYAADMAVWMWALLERGKMGVTYNVGSEQPVTMWRLAQEVQRNFNHPMIVEEPIYKNDARPYYVPDTFKTRQDCGVQITVPFEDAIARTVAWYREEAKLHD